jgi:DNA-binding NarL/FixJ family response regulator
MQERACADLRACTLVQGAGHWVQQEQPEQVAALLLDGASNKAIARALEISVHTAKFHVTAVLDKVGARNRADAVAIIMREGLIAL